MPFVNDGFAKQDPAGGGGGGGSSDASDLTSGTLADARLSSGILNATYQHNQYVLTTGPGTAYVAAPAVAVALAAGAEILCGIHATSGLNPTLNVSGTGAKSILKETSAGLVAVTAGQLVSGPNIYKFTYNAGFDAWVVSSPMPIVAGDLPSHSHAASDTTSGSFNTARLADGTATAGYVPIADGDGTSTWGAPSASDSTKLPLAGGTMTGNIIFDSTGSSNGLYMSADSGCLALGSATGWAAANGAFSKYYGTSHGTNAGEMHFTPGTGGDVQFYLPSAEGFRIFDAGTERLKIYYSNGINRAILDAPFNGILSLSVNGNRNIDLGYAYTGLLQTLYFSANMTPLGATYPEIYNTSTGLHHNVPNGLFHEFHEAGTGFLRLSGDYGVLMDGNSQTFHPSLKNIFASAEGCLRLNGASSLSSAICTEGGGTTYPEVMVHGLAETAYAGAIEIKAGAIARTNNGTWTNIYSLAKGTHVGHFMLSAIDTSVCTKWVWYDIQNTAIAKYASDSGSHTWVNSGGEAAGNIAIRISGGYVQINVGTSVDSALEVAIQFFGFVT